MKMNTNYFLLQKVLSHTHYSLHLRTAQLIAVTRIRTGVIAATTQGPNH